MNSPITRKTISAFIVCCNEESRITRSLESVKWCDEIVVVDSGSTDATLEICKRYTDRIYQRAWPGYVEQKRFALGQCQSEWILNLDADEEVSPALRDEIIKDVLENSAALDGYQINRVVFYLNRWWRKGGWYPEFRLRLCRRAATSWGGRDPHEKALVEGPTKRLKGELYHYTYADISDHVRRLNSYASTAARSSYADGHRAHLIQIFLNPLSRFLKFYLIKKGFLEGFPGLIVGILESYYVFLKYIKLWEIGRDQARS
jgi:glycosyltransferase involved in cell wall biosynthesis